MSKRQRQKIAVMLGFRKRKFFERWDKYLLEFKKYMDCRCGDAKDNFLGQRQRINYE
jgi:hypothetical protein